MTARSQGVPLSGILPTTLRRPWSCACPAPGVLPCMGTISSPMQYGAEAPTTASKGALKRRPSAGLTVPPKVTSDVVVPTMGESPALSPNATGAAHLTPCLSSRSFMTESGTRGRGSSRRKTAPSRRDEGLALAPMRRSNRSAAWAEACLSILSVMPVAIEIESESARTAAMPASTAALLRSSLLRSMRTFMDQILGVSRPSASVRWRSKWPSTRSSWLTSTREAPSEPAAEMSASTA